MSRGSEHIDDLLDGFVGAVVGGFELAVWTVFEVRAVVEAAIRDAVRRAVYGRTEIAGRLGHLSW